MKLGNHKATNTALDALKKPAGATRKLQMNIKMSLVPEFERLYNEFASTEDGMRYLTIEGIAPHQLDIGDASHKFFEEKL